MATITVLLSLLLPALTRLRQGAKAVQCMSNLRVVAYDFQLFANDSFDEDRGDSKDLPPGVFRFEDFVEREYRVSEHWGEGSSRVRQQLTSRADHMLCPAVPEPLYRVPDKPCTGGALDPYSSVGYSFNARLYIQTQIHYGRPRGVPALVRSEVLNKPTIPLAFDVDGVAAQRSNVAPFFTAPPVEGFYDVYADGSMWFPSKRHSGRMNVVFAGGYVRTTDQAAAEHGWDWKYQPDPIE